MKKEQHAMLAPFTEHVLGHSSDVLVCSFQQVKLGRKVEVMAITFACLI